MAPIPKLFLVVIVTLTCWMLGLLAPASSAIEAASGEAAAPASPDLFQRSNLVAWCIVPFDAARRGPAERAAMLASLGLQRLAYDYRAEHVSQFDSELTALKEHGIEMTAWWFPSELNDEAKHILDLLKRHQVSTQLWVSGGGGLVNGPEEHAERVRREVQRLKPIAEAAAAQGSQVGLYNHGGWFGHPDHQIEIIETLGMDNVGIVYNLHHGHEHSHDFAALLDRMLPHLLALNLNGMMAGPERSEWKILPIGQGDLDRELIRIIAASGYDGPIGILDHDSSVDARERLLDNLDGLDWLTPQINTSHPLSPRPTPRSWTPPGPPPVADINFASTPVNPAWRPLHTLDVNSNRVYDFYAKQALHYLSDSSRPAVLQGFPGLEGAEHGHWGTQEEKSWADDRWHKADLGPVIAGVVHTPNGPISKAVSLKLGENGDWTAVFDPASMSFPWISRGGFVEVTAVRRGFIDGLRLPVNAEQVKSPEIPIEAASATYLGYYRTGNGIVFALRLNDSGADMLLSIDVVDDRPVITMTPRDEHPLRHALKGSPARWPDDIVLEGRLGDEQPYAIDTVPLPFDNPYGTLWFIGDHDFFSNGDAAVSTMTGEVWIASGLDEGLTQVRWNRFATGLHQPLGLKIIDDQIHVLGRDQITRLHDLNSNGEADFYECVSNLLTTSQSGHDYVIGLENDDEGWFYFTSGNQGLCRVHPDGRFETLATGFRNPNGLARSANGTLTTSVQEGDWTPASMVFQITESGGFHGYPGPPSEGVNIKPPLVYLPRGVDNSSGGQVFADDPRWGPLSGELIHFSPGYGIATVILRQQVGDLWQGAVLELPGDFLSGVQRGRVHPLDGQVYVSGMLGWVNYIEQDGAFQRLRYTGGEAHLPTAFEARENGVLLTFSDPLDPAIATNAGNHFAQAWNYRYSNAYGSREWSLRWPDQIGHDVLEVTAAHIDAEGRQLFLEIPRLTPANQVHLHLSLTEDIHRDMFLTVHKLAPPFEDYPGYVEAERVHMMPHPDSGSVVHGSARNPWLEGPAGMEFVVDCAQGLRFEQERIYVTAGQRVSLRLNNPDAMPHNWVLIKPGQLEQIGNEVTRLISDPSAPARHYVPQSDAVLVYTDMLKPGESMVIHFDAPGEPGEYPYLCTFPGHWQIMNGILVVE